MSYTPPAGNAANFTWVGQEPYTNPAGDEANFGVEVPATLGWLAVPGPLAAPQLVGLVTKIGAGVGWSAFQPGAPFASAVYQASPWGEVSSFGTPATPTYAAVSAYNYASETVFGHPLATPVFAPTPTRLTVAASGWRGTRLGVPTTSRNETATQAGWLSSSFGPVAAVSIGRAEPLNGAPMFGAPTLRSGQKATALAPATAFGMATTEVLCMAVGTLVTKFPAAKATGTKQYRSYGWSAGFFGAPRAWGVAESETAEGFSCAQFGEVYARGVYRATPCSTSARFSSPTIRRTRVC
jgi:hypothetical protein